MVLLNKSGVVRWLAGMTVAMSLTLAATTGNAAPHEGARAFLDGLNKEVVAEVAAPGLDEQERQRNFRVILRRVFSLDEICRQILGRYGRTATADERQEFRQLFEDMLVLTWTRRFREYTGAGVRFDDVVPVANGDVVVRSQVEGADHQVVSVEWRLRGEGDDYRLLDISAEGASMLLTYRAEYQSLLRNGGLAGLNALLRKKLGELGGAG